MCTLLHGHHSKSSFLPSSYIWPPLPRSPPSQLLSPLVTPILLSVMYKFVLSACYFLFYVQWNHMYINKMIIKHLLYWNTWFKNIEIDLFCQFQILTFLSFMLFNLNCQSPREEEGTIIVPEVFSSFVYWLQYQWIYFTWLSTV